MRKPEGLGSLDSVSYHNYGLVLFAITLKILVNCFSNICLKKVLYSKFVYHLGKKIRRRAKGGKIEYKKGGNQAGKN